MSLTLVSLLVLNAACAGADTEVPVRVAGFTDADAEWLRTELAGWVSSHDRRVCEGDRGLTLTLTELEVLVTFDFKGRHHERALSRGAESAELFRYQVAATAEELVRATWEAPPAARFGVFARGALTPLAVGPALISGGAGVEFFPLPSVGLELSGDGGALTKTTLPLGGEVSGSVVRGALSLSWLPLRPGVLRAGLRAGGEAGALSLTVSEGATSTSGTAPWLAVRGGVTVGLEVKHFAVALHGEVGGALLGGAVLSEGVPVLRVRGLFGAVTLQAGVRW